MRNLRKEWKNKSHGWDRRIRWYDATTNAKPATDESDIRLQLEDNAVGRFNVYPKTVDDAKRIWGEFRSGRNIQELYFENGGSKA